MPEKIPVTALSFKKDDQFLIVSGEISPGIRTPKVRKYKIAEAAEPFGVINYTVLALYLLISLGIGIYFMRKQKSTEDYFVGGGRIPWWASGLSVFGTLLSAITFMAIPAKAFITDWSFFMLTIAAILITPVIAFLFIPFSINSRLPPPMSFWKIGSTTLQGHSEAFPSFSFNSGVSESYYYCPLWQYRL
ncbi:hypothetical protein Q2T40_00215 [Winogradskyella maritima]|nr:hypothetical protein [Winogradskyella maritima]